MKRRSAPSIAELLGEDALGQRVTRVEHHEDVDLALFHHVQLAAVGRTQSVTDSPVCRTGTLIDFTTA